MKHLFTIALAIVTLNGWAQSKLDTLTVTTIPSMHCQNCETKIKQNIRFVKGTKKIDTSIPLQKVTIIYDNRKTSYDAYTDAFRKIGYEIRRYKKKND